MTQNKDKIKEESIEEAMKPIYENLEQRNKFFREMLQECNGKTMDYESCRLLEEAFVFNGKNLVDSFIEGIKKLKELNSKRKK